MNAEAAHERRPPLTSTKKSEDKSTDGRRHRGKEGHPASHKTQWLSAVRDSDLGDRELLVALVLGTWMSAEGQCWPSLEAIAKGVRRHVATIARALIVLEASGWISRQRGGGRGRSTLYRARIPSHLDPTVSRAIPSHLDATVSGRNSRRPSRAKVSQEGTETLAPSARRSTEVSVEGPTGGGLAPPGPVTDYINKRGLRRPSETTHAS
jgi:Helix-turn-helix domain